MNADGVLSALVQVVVGGGIVGYGLDALRERKRRARHAGREPAVVESLHLQNADASLLTVARARDELEEDNARCRAALAEERALRVEERAQHAAERREWWAEREQLRGEITTLEGRIRDLADELTAIRTRHGI